MIRKDNTNYGLSTEKEFLEKMLEQDLGENVIASGVPLYYSKKKVYTDKSDSHTLIFGNTGSKKTRNFCIPSVYTIGMAGESMVISDPKGEIYRYTSGFLSEQGYDIKVLNLRNPEKGSRWNPILLPYKYYKNGDPDKACELLYDFCNQLKLQVHSEKDPYWELQATDLLMGIILILFEAEPDEKKIHMESVMRIRTYIACESDDETDVSNVFWDLVRTFPEDSLIRYKLASVYSLRKVDKTLNCVISTLDSMIRSFILNKNLMNMISTSEIDFYNIPSEKTALYLITPDEKTMYHFLVSVFVKQCYECLIDKAQNSKGGVLPIRVNFVLDEFSNFPKIADMPAMISAARSRNIRFVLVVQSNRQLLSGYGDDAETIKSNCKNWIYLTCRELSLLKEISELCGTIEVDGAEKHVLSTNDLQRLRIGWEDSQALILSGNLLPFITWVKDFSVYPQSKYEAVPFVTRKSETISSFSPVKYVCAELDKEIKKKDMNSSY